MPFFRILKRETFGENKLNEDNITTLVTLTKNIFLAVENETKLTGFWERSTMRNRLKGEIERMLLQEPFIKLPNLSKKYKRISSRMMEIAEKNNDIILYAE